MPICFVLRENGASQSGFVVMRALLLIILLANLLLYLWQSGLIGTPAAHREPERLTQQIQPQALRLVPAEELNAVPVCRRIDGLKPDALQALRMLLSGKPGVRGIEAQDQAVTEYRVLIQGLPTVAAVAKKRGELTALGVIDAKLSEETEGGPFVVVLGSFSDETRAQKHLDELSAKGVRTARILGRKTGSDVLVVTLKLDPLRADGIVRELGGWLQEREGAVVNTCAAS